jgi:hypothetical protein
VVGRRGENFGVEKRWKKKIMRAGRMGFSFIWKTASIGSSATGALVAAGSLQPNPTTWDEYYNNCPICLLHRLPKKSVCMGQGKSITLGATDVVVRRTMVP